MAEYETVYAYGEKDSIQKLFPVAEGEPNLVVYAKDPWLGLYGDTLPLPQVFADLFNTPGWQAPRFAKDLQRELALEDSL